MEKKYRLRKKADFDRVYRMGRSVANRDLVLYYLPNEQVPHFRLGVSVSKKVGRAVVRNRLRRLVKEVVRKEREHIKVGYDLVVIVRQAAREADFHQLNRSMIHLLKKGNLYRLPGKEHE